MKLRIIIILALFLLVLFSVASDLSLAAQLNEVESDYILTQIQDGRDIEIKDSKIIGVFDSKNLILHHEPNSQRNLYSSERDLSFVNSRIYIENSIFENDVDFSNLLFRQDFYFRNVIFLGNVTFQGSHFDFDAFFEESVFNGKVNFDDTHFNKKSIFKNTYFNNSVHFTYANLIGESTFCRAKFIGEVDFHETNFNSRADFSESNFSTVSFEKTKFHEIDFSGTTFKQVDFKDFSFERMKLRWDDIKDALVFDGPVYVQLIQNFRYIEEFGDADEAYYQYRKLNQENKEWSISKLADILMQFTCGYGVKPHFVIFPTSLIIILFSGIYSDIVVGILRLNCQSKRTQLDLIKISLSHAFWFSVGTFTSTGYEDSHLKKRHQKLVMLEKFIGWLLITLFVVTLTNVMIRP